MELATMKDFEDGAADPALPKGEVGVEGIVMLESVRFCGEDGEFEQESLHCCSSAAFVKKKKELLIITQNQYKKSNIYRIQHHPQIMEIHSEKKKKKKKSVKRVM